MSKIYVVNGERGEYSDWSTWNVASFTRREDAQLLIDKINAWMVEIRQRLSAIEARHEADLWSHEEYQRLRETKCPYDPMLEGYHLSLDRTFPTKKWK